MFWWFLGQFRIWVPWGSKLGHITTIWKKSCEHSGGHIFDSSVMKLGQDACLLVIAWMRLNIGHFELKTRSQELKIEKSCGYCFDRNILEIGLKVFILWFLGHIPILVTWGQKLGYTAQIWKNLVNTLKATFFNHLSWNLVRMLV
jgi:hypothetical protein